MCCQLNGLNLFSLLATKNPEYPINKGPLVLGAVAVTSDVPAPGTAGTLEVLVAPAANRTGLQPASSFAQFPDMDDTSTMLETPTDFGTQEVRDVAGSQALASPESNLCHQTFGG